MKIKPPDLYEILVSFNRFTVALHINALYIIRLRKAKIYFQWKLISIARVVAFASGEMKMYYIGRRNAEGLFSRECVKNYTRERIAK